MANITVSVSYDVVWNAFDQASHIPYLERVELIGDDTQVAGSVEDGTDDPIPSGLVSLAFVSANATATTTRQFTKTIPLANLNEDSGILGLNLNPDEIQAKVTLSPRLPVVATRESNQVTFNLT